MQIETVAVVLLTEPKLRDERLLTHLAPEVQVQIVKQPSQTSDTDLFDRTLSALETELVWLQEENKTVYRVIEAETGEILQQVPSDEVMRVSRNIEEFLDPEGRE